MKIIVTIALVLFYCNMNAQDTIQKTHLELNGSVDAYYRYNFNNAKKAQQTNNYTSFTNAQNSFELGMASLKTTVYASKVQAVADLGFGKRAAEFSYNDNSSVFNVKQAYVSYSPSSKIKFTMGKWYSHVGYEVPDAYLNRNYSMAYLFSYGPFFHTGIKMEYSPFENMSFMAGVVNPTDFTAADFADKNVIGQIHANSTDKKISASLNYVGGKDTSNAMVNQFDLVLTGTISDQFSIAYNGSIKSVNPADGHENKWLGAAVYLNYYPVNTFGLTLRSELFHDKKAVAGFASNIYDFTLSGNIRFDNLTIIPEFRMDAANKPLFFKKTDEQLSSSKATGSFIIAATYHF